MISKKAKPSGIEKVDRNFQVQSSDAQKPLRWIDAFDRRVALRGLGWVEENRAAKSFRRIPDRAEARLSEAIGYLSYRPCSAFVAFETDSENISVRMENKDTHVYRHMAATGSAGSELFCLEGNRWLSCGIAIPDAEKATFERRLVRGLPPGRRSFRLYLPLYMLLIKLEVGLDRGARVGPVPPPAGSRPIIVYGTSITQGGCANTAGSDFVSILGRMLETDTVNLGFSGNGRGEPEVAELMRELDAEMFVIDYFGNCEPERVKKTLPPFVRILREKHPTTPIVLLGMICYDWYLWKPEFTALLDGRRHEVMEYYLRARRRDPNLYFIDGFGVLQPGMNGAYVDGAHTTSMGFAVMAERIYPHLMTVRWLTKRRQSGRGDVRRS